MTTRILILGGTGEARRLSERLAGCADVNVITSLAGRTAAPRMPAGAVRVGGFGGPEGLVRYLRDENISLMIDATHPFAARMGRNAMLAAGETAIPLITLMRPPWQPVAGDDWCAAASMAEAARLLGDVPRRVFLAIGRQEVGAFAGAPQHHYLVRSVEPVDPAHLPPDAECILARGPFTERDEQALLREHRCQTVVAKNSGGAATYAKIAAARALGLPVIMIDRPKPTGVATVGTVDEALQWIGSHAGLSSEERGA